MTYIPKGQSVYRRIIYFRDVTTEMCLQIRVAGDVCPGTDDVEWNDGSTTAVYVRKINCILKRKRINNYIFFFAWMPRPI